MGIRMGASGNPALYRGTVDALVRIAREEGVVGLYRCVQVARHGREHQSRRQGAWPVGKARGQGLRFAIWGGTEPYDQRSHAGRSAACAAAACR